jgi:hypothetical protein
MTSIGTTITLSVCLQYPHSPALLARGLASVLVIVPTIGITASVVCGLDLTEKVRIALIVMAPRCAARLTEALVSGADTGFAATLQIVVALLSVAVVPVWVIMG